MFRLFEQGLYSDVTFVIDERTFSLHRCVLAARSSFFQEAFEKRWYEKRHIHLTKAKVFFSF
jgi:ankyrin repeat/BTB/POZ domain-containing protein 1